MKGRGRGRGAVKATDLTTKAGEEGVVVNMRVCERGFVTMYIKEGGGELSMPRT